MSNSFALLRTYLGPLRLRVALLMALILLGIGLDLLNPQLVRTFIDDATSSRPIEDLLRTAILFIGVALLTQAVAVGVTYLGQSVGWTATNALRADLAEHCLKLDLSFHKTRTAGEMIERVDGDVTNLTSLFSQLTLSILGNAILLIGVVILLWIENVWVGVSMAIFALISIAVMVMMRSVAVPFWAQVRQKDAEFYGFLGEQLAGTEDVRANGATGYVMWRFFHALRSWLPLQRKAGLASYSLWMSTILLFAIGHALAFALGAWLYSGGQISIGTVFLIFNYTELLRRPIEQIRAQIQELQKAVASVGRIQELFTLQTRLTSGTATLPSGAISVTIADLSFAYDDENVQPFNRSTVQINEHPSLQTDEQSNQNVQPFNRSTVQTDEHPSLQTDEQSNQNVQPFNRSTVQTDEQLSLPADEHPNLQTSPPANPPTPQHPISLPLKRSNVRTFERLNVPSLHLPPATTLGLLGRTGSGKTSLARLLLRLYDPTEGTIRLGGVDLRTVTTHNLRQRVGMVTQDVQLFNATIRENLTLFRPDISDDRILTALDALGLTPWLHAQSNGLDSTLQIGGISAGEAQLLAFARLFLSDPGLVVLDEASSRLDPATETLLERAIERLLAGRTGIIIAHRLATVQRADVIMILEAGNIIEYGPRLELARDPNSHFARLLQTGLEEVLA